MKQDILNRVRTSKSEFDSLERAAGDEIDQSVATLSESQFLISHARLRNQLSEIESALARIERGTYGLCEETDESIETQRLLAIPWTRLSIEGAEIRESLRSRFAR
jgi:DnaK suppressor protein